MASLAPDHLEALRTSAICDVVIRQRGYQTVSDGSALPPCFTAAQRTGRGLLIPIRNVHGDVATYQFRPDTPRVDVSGRPIKYENPTGGHVYLDVPAEVRPLLRNASVPLWITEGSKKVDAALSNGMPCVIGLLGVWGWLSGKLALPDWREIQLGNREVIIAFDSDVMRKPAVRSAILQLAEYLRSRGSRVRFLILPDLPGGAKCGLDDWFANGRTREELGHLIDDQLPGADPDWQTPLPLHPEVGPELDPEFLPLDLAAYVQAVATATQTSIGMVVAIALGCLSAATQGAYDVVLAEHNWYEVVVLQIVTFAPSGERKSAVISEISEALLAWERAYRAATAPLAAEWESKRRVLQMQLDHAERAAVQATSGQEALEADQSRVKTAGALTKHLAAPVYPFRLVADDVTPEKAKELIIQQRGALAITSAEPTFFSIVAGRYANHPALDVMLNGHAGEPITVDRKTGGSAATPRGCLTITIACQPDVAVQLGAVPGFVSRGGAARLLPVFAPSRVGHRSIEAIPVPPELRERWHTIVRRVLVSSAAAKQRSGGDRAGVPLTLSSDAYAAFQDFRSRHEPRLGPGYDLAPLADWGNKQPGAALRIAGVLHAALHDDPARQSIDAETMRQAIAISEWFAEHAKVMYRVMSGRGGDAAARQVLDVLLRLHHELQRTPTKSELLQAMRGRVGFHRARDLDAPLATLEEYGYLRIVRHKTGGRPSDLIALNPQLTASPEILETLNTSPAPEGAVPGRALSSVSRISDEDQGQDQEASDALLTLPNPDHDDGNGDRDVEDILWFDAP